MFARQERTHRHYSGNDWYIGAITNEQARTVNIDLNFLPVGKTFEAQIYQDTKATDWQENPYAIDIKTQKVQSSDQLQLYLAAAGGAAVRLKMVD